MNLQQGEQFIETLITPHLQEDFHSNLYLPLRLNFPELSISYPGNRNTRIRGLDYLLKLNGNSITHNQIAKCFRNLAEQIPATTLIDLIINIYNHGQEVNINHLPHININIGNMNLSWYGFKELIFFIVIQENFNFPQPYCWGMKMPFIRYIEAIFSANFPNKLNLAELNRRIDSGTRNLIQDMPEIYSNSINHILNH